MCFGTVISENPLKIKVEQRLILSANQLILTRSVTDYKTEVTVDWISEETGRTGTDSRNDFYSHSHGIKGRKEIIIHNGLKVNDGVILARMQGGQKYLVIDKAGV